MQERLRGQARRPGLGHILVRTWSSRCVRLDASGSAEPRGSGMRRYTNQMEPMLAARHTA